MSKVRRDIMLIVVGGSVVALDQVTKIWVQLHMKLHASKSIIPDVLDLNYIRNPGAAFGILSGSHSFFRLPFLVGISILAIGIILYLFHKMDESEILVPVSLSLVLGGAIGNLIDRIRFGEVIDFISFHYKGFAWPCFNVADIAITTGVFLLTLRMLFLNKGSKEKQEGILPPP